jgi:hypothetical protein
MPVGGEVVGVGEPREQLVRGGVAGRDPFHAEGPGRRGVAGGDRWVWGGDRVRHGLVRVRHRVVHAQTLPRRPAVPSITMATMEECRSALDKLSDNLAGAHGEVRTAAGFDRSLSCHITDLDLTFRGELVGGRIEVADTVPGPPPDVAQIGLAMTGDDLVALVDGELNFARAWASGRVKLDASFRDLLRLRSLL